jgi:hypothetical protein
LLADHSKPPLHRKVKPSDMAKSASLPHTKMPVIPVSRQRHLQSFCAASAGSRPLNRIGPIAVTKVKRIHG